MEPEKKLKIIVMILVAGIKKTGKDVFLNPSPDTKIEAGDILIVIGDREGLEKLEKLYGG